MVQCTACHDPHDNLGEMFPVMDNTGSALCRECHRIGDFDSTAHALSMNTWNGSGKDPRYHTQHDDVAFQCLHELPPGPPCGPGGRTAHMAKLKAITQMMAVKDKNWRRGRDSPGKHAGKSIILEILALRNLKIRKILVFST